MNTGNTLTPALEDRPTVASPSAVGTGGHCRKVKRPLAITAVCISNVIIAGIVALFFVGLAVTAASPGVAIGLLLAGAVLVSVRVVCAIGMWRMQRWGVHAYAISHGLMLVGDLVAGASFNPGQLILPAITLLVGYRYILFPRSASVGAANPSPRRRPDSAGASPRCGRELRLRLTPERGWEELCAACGFDQLHVPARYTRFHGTHGPGVPARAVLQERGRERRRRDGEERAAT